MKPEVTAGEKLVGSEKIQNALGILLSHGRKRPLSIREVSRRLNYSSDRAIGMVLTGERPMSEEMLKRFSGYFSLTEKQSRVLKLLTEKHKALAKGDSSELKKVEAELMRIRTPFDYDTIQQEQLRYFEEWFSLPLLRLVSRNGRMSLLQIVSRFEGKVSKADLENALSMHVDAGKLVRVGADSFEAAKPRKYFKTPTDIPSV
ncbi:MAG: hypothetical protein V4692_07575, partial [Bdellovibrionota bacterium]